MLHGIDVASYQGANPDFSGCQVVAIKATEGTTYVNPDLASQVADARKAKCRIVFYHYPHIHNPVTSELKHFLDTVTPMLLQTDALCLDWEWYGQTGVTEQNARDYKDAFVNFCKNARHNKCLVYSDRNNWLNVDTNSNAGDGLWIADYVPGAPRIKHPWVGWQYSDKPEDEDSWNFDTVAHWDEWATVNFPKNTGGPVSTPKPVPAPTVDVSKEAGWGVWSYKNPDPGPDAWARLQHIEKMVQEIHDHVFAPTAVAAEVMETPHAE